ncbi:carnitine O-acetyltransferase [Endogone sp. FLAS-F59071]|nr:carnitine O-acetyltransferase [Endogone sp. FLAS-F59071]|eukprot:RUS19526.1 carnitine O-acetyltransferase [Endogone sp. FLAS-F59071]
MFKNGRAGIVVEVGAHVKCWCSSTTERWCNASRSISTLIALHDLQVLAYNGYGKSLIKRFGVSPDAYVQMAIQLTYYNLFGVCRPTYESVHTRKFHRGRTDVCRGVSIESIRWVEAMEDPTLPIEVKVTLGKEAIESHVRYSTDCAQGQGIERHLLGLRCALHPDEPIPTFFTDPAFSYSSHWYVSTSQVPSERIEGFGYGQVVPDGFGIAYIIKNDSLHFNVTSLRYPTVHGKLFPDASKKMRASLLEAVERMRYVFEAGLSMKIITFAEDSRL